MEAASEPHEEPTQVGTLVCTTRRPPKAQRKVPKNREGQCEFFIKKKGRRCNIERSPGSSFCGNHLPQLDQAAADGPPGASWVRRHGTRRITCPLDPGHTIFEAQLKGHLRVCNKLKDELKLQSEPIYCKDINCGGPLCEDSLSPPADADALMSRLMGLFAELKGRLEPELEELTQGPIAAPIMATVDASGFGYNQARHVIQQASMVSHLHRRGLLAQGSTCIEFGAGRGNLGAAVHLSFPDARVVLIERMGVRKKADAEFRRTGVGSYFERYKMDLKDLDLTGFGESLSDRPTFIGKHVCGVATDLALRSVGHYVAKKQGARVGVLIATCCFHACSFKAYVGRSWWEGLGLTGGEFELARRWACWWCCHWKARRTEGQGGDAEQQQQEEEHEDPEEEGEEGPWRPPTEAEKAQGRSEERRQGQLKVGKACKRLIDHGRLEYLRSLGLKAELIEYCAVSVTPENTAICAWTES